MSDHFEAKESGREKAFASIWANDIDKVFSEVAAYYDRASFFASLGLWDRLRHRFVSTIHVKPGDSVLDLCAGTNDVAIDLLNLQPGLDVIAADRNSAMQKVGRNNARKQGVKISSVICDAHHLPFPDNHFDVVTMQWATRHLSLIAVLAEIRRVLKPGGYIYNGDLSRPKNKLVERIYSLFLKTTVIVTSRIFASGPASLRCRRYFVQAIRLFYSAEELSKLLEEQGFEEITARTMLAGTVTFHKARKLSHHP